MRKLVIVLIPLLILALVLGAIGCDDEAAPTAEAPPALRVATVNLLHGFESEVNASTLLHRLSHHPGGCLGELLLPQGHLQDVHHLP